MPGGSCALAAFFQTRKGNWFRGMIDFFIYILTNWGAHLKMDDNAMRDTVDSDNNLAQSIVVEPAQKVGNLIDLDFSDSQINYPDQEIK